MPGSNPIDLRATRGLNRYFIPTWVFLWGTVVVYSAVYLGHPSLPGNNLAFPQGWWGWFDQSQYLKEAKALAAHQFSPDNFYYPVLYPLIGRIFLHWTPNHPFFLFDGFSLLLFVYVFVKFADHYLSRVEILVITAASIWFQPTVIDNFAIPWTTSGTTLIYALSLLILIRQRDTRQRDDDSPAALLWAGLLSLLFGALIILRPVDVVLAAVFFPAYIYFALPFRDIASLLRQRRRVLAICSALGLGIVFGLMLFAAVNYRIYGKPMGGYLQSTAGASGYFITELPRKTWSLLFDANSIYLEPQAALVTHYPWLLLSIVGVVIAIARGDQLLRVVALAILLHFALYAPYGDLLPEGMWRYHNIHYFKWAIPYLALLAWLALRWVWGGSESRLQSRVLRASCAAILVLLVLCLQFKISDIDSIQQAHSTSQDGNPVIEVVWSAHKSPADFIDFHGLTGQFTDVYFGQHRVWVDGHELGRIRDFRMIPAPWGVRLLFNRPVTGSDFKLLTGKGLTVQSEALQVVAASYRLAPGRPRLPVFARKLEEY
ncbi:hypothetical protein M3A49_10770 [Paraburkholderia sp. CNPSo 3076]|uniref:hypothetical protein n=1 Tax=Paraburkholderia sp. CNPSo 3076 TaxID=2940936 RepID=UPI00224D0831|nr:hypothetical protein [Paraburkholderia sp. CNPSo 3076]MCX5539975.1 hypothetical protein [Paraburkholderia sp. CNPSo 3076]